MEVHLTPDAKAKLEKMARDSGRGSDELVADAVIGLYDELTYTRKCSTDAAMIWKAGVCSRLTARKPTGVCWRRQRNVAARGPHERSGAPPGSVRRHR